MTRDDLADIITDLRQLNGRAVFARTDYADVYDGIRTSQRATATVMFEGGQYEATVTEWQLEADPVFSGGVWDEVQSHEHKAKSLAALLYTLRTEYGITEREW